MHVKNNLSHHPDIQTFRLLPPTSSQDLFACDNTVRKARMVEGNYKVATTRKRTGSFCKIWSKYVARTDGTSARCSLSATTAIPSLNVGTTNKTAKWNIKENIMALCLGTIWSAVNYSYRLGCHGNISFL